MGGSILIVFLLHVLSKGKNLQSLILGKKALTAVLIYLIILYSVTTAVIFPERLPKIILPYLLVFLWYLITLGLLWADRYPPPNIVRKEPLFSQNELGIFAIVLICLTILCSFSQPITYGVLLMMFVSLMGAGVFLFSVSMFSLIKNQISQE